MRYVQPDAVIVKITDPLNLVEFAGRVCYRTEDTAKTPPGRLFERLTESGHHSVFEHVNIIFEIVTDTVLGLPYVVDIPRCFRVTNASNGIMYASCNLRLIKESGDQRFIDIVLNEYPELSPYLGEKSGHNDYLLNRVHIISRADFLNRRPREDEIGAHLSTTVLLTTDRGVANELVRHRECAFSQESSRYCNYSKDKFGNEISCILPPQEMTEEAFRTYTDALVRCEKAYLSLQEKYGTDLARGVLPLELATTLVMTSYHSHWVYIFGLRYFEKTGKVHPNMKALMSILREHYNQEYWHPFQ